ncbi:cadherin-13 isoform X2 [Pezoporus wallicus]|uniref:cadherin-13 isoform X2 n=1 Tax=Pezoporus wallicus TaxID=35540 RepID=UPI00254D790C|nr:cadherin-13 isoform X2 [Pezoporus wallicus]
MQHKTQLALPFLLSQVLLLVCADLECVPGFQQKAFYIEEPFQFTEDQPVLKLKFDDCKGNNKLTFEVSNPDFKVERDGTLVALKNMSEAGRTFFVHAQSEHAEDLAEILIVEEKEKHSALKDILKVENNLGFLRQKRAILSSPVLVPENQRGPFPRYIGKVVSRSVGEGVRFRLSGKGADEDPKGIFKINEITGDISVTQVLDREAAASYELEVEITDVNGKIIDGPVRLEVLVIDQNDNKPLFKDGPYVGHVMEGSPTGTTVMRITAVDGDDANTDNALIRYDILKQTPDKPSPNMFFIDPEKGDIVTVVSSALLDRETMETPQYELVIEAKDLGGHDVGLSGTATATIVIDDKNDHAPEFTKKEFLATVKEGITGVIVNLTIRDQDDPATGAWRALYTIINGNAGQSFEIRTNPQNNEGMLSVVKPLDYEISAFHRLMIKVENEDPLVPDIVYGPSSTATVQITVEDVNEGPIFHPNPMRVTKLENIPIGSKVLTVNATDPDTLQHQTIRYSIYKDPAGWLEISPTNGTIITTAPLDRESVYVQNDTYTALFLAIDNGHPPATGTGTLYITLGDVNDNVPSLYPTLAKVCDDGKDLRIVVLGATDKDLPPNTDPFTFELSKQTGPEKMWRLATLNDTHAQIILLQNLQKANYNIPISVTDSGNPPLTNNTELKLQVCACRKSKMDCSATDALHISMTLIFLSLFSLLCKSFSEL